MDPLVWLLILSIAMLLGSYLAGSLPLSTKLSENKIRLLNALGAGLLVGTSLMVVIPEGIETIYNSTAAPSSITPNSVPGWVEYEHKGPNKREPVEEGEGGEHSVIGLALIIGFALMYIIDQVSSLHMSNTCSATEYTELGVVGGGSLEGEEVNENTEVQNHATVVPTVGLLVHAAADGIALGASATHPQLSFVVFMAIMLHKAPASFALTSVLLSSGISHNAIRKHLLIFALAAPVGALITYFILYFFSTATTSAASLEYWTGVLLVFSGGTFLYVAMHALQEVSHSGRKDRSHLLLVLGGMLAPILLNLTHSH